MNTRGWFQARARTRSIRWLAGAVVAVLALFAAAAGVAAHGPDPIFSGRWLQNQALGFSWRSGAAVPKDIYQVAIKAAAADASASRGSQAATFAYVAGSTNLIGYGAGATCGTLGIACFSRNPTSSFSMWMREENHRFDWGLLHWCQSYGTWPDGCFDVENIMLDEFGHVEILNHHENLAGGSDYLDAIVQTKSNAKPQAGWNVHAFARCDVASLQLQYDMQGWGAKYSTCLDLATTLTLGASAGYVTYGGTVNLTASLKVAADSTYVRLAQNPVSLRSVSLERRAVGSTTWSTVGTMSYGPASGTYLKAVQLTTPTEFRAVFRTPTDEGLRGTSSPAVTVVIGP